MLDQKLQELHKRLTDIVLGADEAANLLLTALLARGHVLIEGAPGIGKTSIAQALADAIGGDCKRIQFTPDLLPSDILGYNLYRQHDSSFEFIAGPIFSNLVVADEINRTSPRVQSALLEAMNEGHVSIDGTTHVLEEPFFVIATQNDTSYTGTFPLPEPQLDRFLLSIPMQLPPRSVQEQILLKPVEHRVAELESLFTKEEIKELQQRTDKVGVSEALASYVVDLCEEVRMLSGGPHTVSVRAAIAVVQAARANAVLAGAEHVLPDHVQAVFMHVLSHRLLCDDGGDPYGVLANAIERVEVP